MKLSPRLAASLFLLAMLFGTETGRTSAQDSPPDLRMLMNMDLFEPRSGGSGPQSSSAPGAAPTDDSMLSQIRTLNEMGFLGGRAEAGENAPTARGADARDVPPLPQQDVAPNSSQPVQEPSAQPSYDAEGPEP